MRIRLPDYYAGFHCLAGNCPHSCCAGWEVSVDEETACRYFAVPGSLGERLRAALQDDGEGAFCFPLDGGRCPFLNGENLCEIHLRLGADATGVTCREHPRFMEDYGPFREVTLSASCPAANALLLGSERPLTFLEEETGEPEEAGDGWLPYLLSLRRRVLALLAEAGRPLRRRLTDVLALAWDAQMLLDADRPEALTDLAAHFCPRHCPGDWPAGPGLFPGALRFLQTLEALDGDWRALLERAESTAPGAAPEALLGRIASYFAFRYLLKSVNDGDLFGRAQLCVLAVLTVERLSALTGLSEALRRFSRELEHSEENLELLQAGFRQREELAPARFFQELSL